MAVYSTRKPFVPKCGQTCVESKGIFSRPLADCKVAPTAVDIRMPPSGEVLDQGLTKAAEDVKVLGSGCRIDSFLS